MNRKLSLGWVICLIFLTMALTFLATWQISENEFNKNLTTSKLTDSVAKKVTEVQNLINQHYIEDISEADLTDFAAKGLASSIGDKYAQYFTADEYQDRLIKNSGKFTGVGLAIKIQSGGYILITDVYENSPAEKAGIKIGDTISKIGGKDVTTLSTQEINELIAGKEGDVFNLTITKDGNETDYSLIRTQFDRVYVTSKMLDGAIGYIRISEFEDTTAQQFKAAYEELTLNGAKAFIFDLRNNGGGSASALCDCVDPLVGEGNIATVKYKDGSEKVMGVSDKTEMSLPSVVLVNSNTASAAELFTATLKDFGKAEIVGMNTFGKGVMQETFSLSDGSAIKLTTAKYYTPKGENYDGVGLKPDYEVTQSADEQLLIFAKTETDDLQLQKAIEVVSAKVA